jgi:hypothetical protein
MSITHMVRCKFGRHGFAWHEAPTIQTRDELIRALLGGQFDDPRQVLELDPGGINQMHCRDVSAEIARELVRRSMAEDRSLTPGVRRFVDHHYAREAA